MSRSGPTLERVLRRSQVETWLHELKDLKSDYGVTGGLEQVAALAAASLPVAVVNPRQVRDFAKSVTGEHRAVGED